MGTIGAKEINIDLIHFPVLTLGPGRRVGIWLQGCNIRCAGCMARHTWEIIPEAKLTVADVLNQVRSFSVFAEGVTISGGEPFEQPDALFGLLSGLRNLGFADILLYSGHAFNRLKGEYSNILDFVDVLVDGQFIVGLETDCHWKGSENQNMLILTREEALKKKYEDYRAGHSAKRGLQLVEKENKIYIIGIPRQDDAKVIRSGFD